MTLSSSRAKMKLIKYRVGKNSSFLGQISHIIFTDFEQLIVTDTVIAKLLMYCVEALVSLCHMCS